MWELWQRMNEFYGHRWASQQGDEPNDTWIKGCADITNRQLADGLRAMLNRKDPWPPSLPEFRVLCLEGDNNRGWERQCHRVIDLPALEDLTAKDARKARNREEMRKLREAVFGGVA